jgi:HAD superfamily hydrolase (TIGR01493 family)
VNPLKLFAFDLLGTVFDMSGVDRDELRAYGRHLKDFYATGEWKPLHLPASWERLPLFQDSALGLGLLQRNYMIVTLSNAPLGLTAKMCKNAGIMFDAITPLELSRTYKTAPEAYTSLCSIYGVEPREIAMVTANKDFGDIEAARKLGMSAYLIRDEKIPTVVDLAAILSAK